MTSTVPSAEQPTRSAACSLPSYAEAHAMIHVAAAAIAAPYADPIFAAIAHNRDGMLRRRAILACAIDVPAEQERTCPLVAASHEACCESWSRWRDGVLITRPTTPAGAQALARHVLEWMQEQGEADDDDLRDYRQAFALIAGTPPLGPTPALVRLIDEWSALSARINAGGLSDEEVNALVARLDELQLGIYAFPAASVADLAAKTPVFRDELEDAIGGLDDDAAPESTLPGAAWLGLFRDFARLSQAVSVGTSLQAHRIDPIFAAIERHRLADEAHQEAGATLSRAQQAVIDAERASLPEIVQQAARSVEAAAEAVEDDAGLAERQEWTDLLATVPTTEGGRHALLAYALDFLRRSGGVVGAAVEADAAEVLVRATRPLTPRDATSDPERDACLLARALPLWRAGNDTHTIAWFLTLDGQGIVREDEVARVLARHRDAARPALAQGGAA
ncbi:hypothetical protein [Methylobacterium nodulans]|uniref:Uncharacterized protein n=1 Tax=Methylobacterium nodulans (strain LMG 21967 / CNCM I-2342 / ORS 2060) TaxID=460265 RepID=B8IT73_METNO|nr:hypothetical protein [Methylobacterium nodulans]ACL56959.1 hypothetical protein Mnod_1971 [Methylobacterium nodulans ORS 2060]